MNRVQQDKMQPKTSKKAKLVWVRKKRSAMDRPYPSPPTRVSCKRAEPQEPTWRRVTPKAAPQRVEPQELALKDKGKGKGVDVTNIASSSTSTPSTPEVSTTKWVVRPKVVT